MKASTIKTFDCSELLLTSIQFERVEVLPVPFDREVCVGDLICFTCDGIIETCFTVPYQYCVVTGISSYDPWCQIQHNPDVFYLWFRALTELVHISID